MSSTELRVIGADDWEDFRAVRLEALADAPDAFGATLAEASAQPPEVWRERAAGPGPVVLAFADHGPVAMGGLFVPDASDDAFVWGMWVRPTFRGDGVAARILERLLEHADRVGRPVVLHVSQGNDSARRLYERHGFVTTGEVQPLREGSPVLIDTMRRR
ncbi:GNAT family N-acetyltransferase [Terrabacter aerolatus]|uniref:GNAT family N-acetyltransferase n=1 Tax=Terrabacter aerolatus TaxID=422442 RepID=UPI001649CC74|nr:GNAT family N-acetyltransferase [Terrabacter aerolatus]